MPTLQQVPISHPADVYLMRMYTERLQILVSKEQRRRLEREAKRRESSVASVIRDAVEAELGSTSRQDRMQAVEAISRIHGALFLPPEELEREIDRVHAEEIGRGLSEAPDA
jgi:predicted DNA-binding protein